MIGEVKAVPLAGPFPPLRLQNILLIAGLCFFAATTILANINRGSGEAALAVTVAAAERTTLKSTVFATGRIEVPGRQEIYVENDSLLLELYVKAGDTVQQGQLLAKMDTTALSGSLEEARASYNEAQAALEKLRRDPLPENLAQERAELAQAEADLQGAQTKLERTRVLYEQGVLAESELEEAERELIKSRAERDRLAQRLSLSEKGPLPEELKESEARVQQALAALNRISGQMNKAVITAAQNGVVLSCNSRVGSYVSAGALLMVVGDPEDLEITADVSENDSGDLAPGQEVTFSCPALRDREFKGTVTQVARAAVKSGIDYGTGQERISAGSYYLPVKVRPTGDIEGLRPGYTVDLTVVTIPEKTAVVVPHEAVLKQDDGEYAFVVKDGKARRRQVQTGIGNELYVEISDGVKYGEKVILNPPGDLEDGRSVREEAKQ
ncbi:MAG TPA: hypothetical protein DCZ10_01470 [Pelotomaculum sp.]|nr:hypothetical protein [Pelotomaculum sp.]